MKKFSVVIVSYNSCDDTLAIINKLIHIKQSANFSLEIVVVDNNSSDCTFSKLSIFRDDVILFQSNKNLGFSRGVNKGISLCNDFDYLILLNSDIILDEQVFVAYLNEIIEKNIFFSVPQICNADGSTQRTLFNFPNIFKTTIGLLGLHPFLSRLIKSTHNLTKNYDYALFAFVIISKKLISEIGVLDNDLIFYHDDCEYCLRVNKLKGNRVTYNNDFSFIHYGGKTSQGVSDYAYYHYYRGLFFLYKKHYSRFDFIFISLLYKVVFSYKLFFNYIFPKDVCLITPTPYKRAFKKVFVDRYVVRDLYKKLIKQNFDD